MNNYGIITNFIWRFAERCGAQFVTLVVSVILARMLEPEVYGVIAIVNVFMVVLQVFVDSGLGNALIQKKECDDIDFSSVFYFNVFLCGNIYILLWLCAPLISKFFNDNSLTLIVRVLGVTLIISGVKNVQQAYVSRNMMFKRFFFSTLGGTIIAAIVGVVMAYNGLGVWALVFQQIVNLFVDTLILWMTVDWRPKFVFSYNRLQQLLSYGWKLLASSLLDTVYSNLRNIIIGKIYSSSDLAFYNQGDKFPRVIVANINASIDSVLLPSMASVQDQRDRIKAMTRRAIKTSTYIMAPLMMGMTFCANSIVRLLLTEKWLPCVPYLQIFCITYMFWPIHTANLNAIKALGRSDLFLKLEIIKKIMGMLLLFATMKISVMAMAYSLIIASVLSQIINSWPNRKLLNYSYLEQLRDIFPSVALAIAMGGCVRIVQLAKLGLVVTLLTQMLLGTVIYIGGSKILRLESFEYLLDIIENFTKRKEGGVNE